MADPNAPGKDVQSSTDEEFFDVLAGRRHPRAGNTSEARAAALRAVYTSRVEPRTLDDVPAAGGADSQPSDDFGSGSGSGSGHGWMKLATAAAIAGIAFGLTAQLAPWGQPDSSRGIQHEEASDFRSDRESDRSPAGDDAAQSPGWQLPPSIPEGFPKGAGEALETRPHSAQWARPMYQQRLLTTDKVEPTAGELWRALFNERAQIHEFLWHRRGPVIVAATVRFTLSKPPGGPLLALMHRHNLPVGPWGPSIQLVIGELPHERPIRAPAQND